MLLRRARCRYVLVLAFAGFFQGPSQSWHAIVPITVTGGSSTIRDTLGLFENATYCIDGELDSLITEVELPPNPAMIFDARFEECRVGSNCLGAGLRLSLQELWKTVTFHLRIMPPPGAPFPPAISRNIQTHGPAGATLLRMTDAYGGALIDIDVRHDTGLVFSSDSLTRRKIYAYWAPGGLDDPRYSHPTHIALEQNYPNPFNGTTALRFEATSRENAALRVFDPPGRHILTLFDGVPSNGSLAIPLDAMILPGGVYYYQLSSGTEALTRRLILAKQGTVVKRTSTDPLEPAPNRGPDSETD